MPPKNSKRKHIKMLYSWPVFLLLVTLTVATVRASYSAYFRYRDEDSKIEKTINDLSAMKGRGDKLRDENEWLKTTRGQEELFREQYMVAKEGENVMIITSNNETTSNSITTETKNNSIINKTKKIIGVSE